MPHWFYMSGQQQVGPMDERALRSLNTAGLVSADALVRREDQAEWRAIRDVPELAAQATPLPLEYRTPVETPREPDSHAYATASLIFGFSGCAIALVIVIARVPSRYEPGWLQSCLSFLAIGAGLNALYFIRRSGIPDGRGMAIAGVILGVAGMMGKLIFAPLLQFLR
jgi:hypothetical protein